jgi:hypothetical protein
LPAPQCWQTGQEQPWCGGRGKRTSKQWKRKKVTEEGKKGKKENAREVFKKPAKSQKAREKKLLRTFVSIRRQVASADISMMTFHVCCSDMARTGGRSNRYGAHCSAVGAIGDEYLGVRRCTSFRYESV